jgi:hypothetical protein
MLDTLADAVRIELTLILATFAALLAWGLLTGRINTRGLLAVDGGGAPSGNKIQLLMITCIAAGYYLLRVYETRDTHLFPPVPEELLLLFAGSHVAFNGWQIRTLFTKQGRLK